MSHSQPSAPALVVASVAALLVLTGCGTPQSAPTAEPTTTSSDTPAPAPLVAPVVRVGAGCADLVDAGTLSGWFEVDKVDDERAAVDTLDLAAVRTSGGIRCRWWGAPAEGGYRPESAWLSVRLDSHDGFGYDDATAHYIEDQYTDFDTAGDDSVLYCSVWDELWSCLGEMRVADYWVSATLQARNAATETQAKQRMQNTLQRAASILRNSGPVGEAWVRPAGAFTGEAMCGDDRSGTIRVISEAWGLSGVKSYGGDVVFTDWETYGATRSRECGFGTSTVGITLSILPGGAWWGDTWDQITLRHWSGVSFDPLVVEGVDRAAVGCAGDDCAAYVIAGGSAFEIHAEGLTRDAFVAGLAGVPDLIAL